MVLSSQKLYILYQNVIFKEYQHSSFKHTELRKCQNWSIILYNIVTILLSTCMSFNKKIALLFLSHTVAFFPRSFFCSSRAVTGLPLLQGARAMLLKVCHCLFLWQYLQFLPNGKS